MNLSDYIKLVEEGREMRYKHLCDLSEEIVDKISSGDENAMVFLPFLHKRQGTFIGEVRAKDFVLKEAKEIAANGGSLEDLMNPVARHLYDLVSTVEPLEDPDKAFIRELGWVCRELKEDTTPDPDEALGADL